MIDLNRSTLLCPGVASTLLLGVLMTAPAAQALEISATQDTHVLLESLGLLGNPAIEVTNATVLFGLPTGINLTSIAASGDQVVGDDPVTYAGVAHARAPRYGKIGTYTNIDATYGLPDQGIALSTGNVLEYGDGPNTSGHTTKAWRDVANNSQQALLDSAAGSDTRPFYDVVHLRVEFNVVATSYQLSFAAAFGSEEYAFYQNSAYNDSFVVALNGENFAAVAPTGGGDPLTINISHPDMSSIPGTELDGMLAPDGDPVFRFDSPVTPGGNGQVLDILIGDRADRFYDSTAYLKLEQVAVQVLPEPPPVIETVMIQDIINLLSNPLQSTATSGKKYKSNGAKFEKLYLPDNLFNDPDGFELWTWDGLQFVFQTILLPNQVFDLTTIDPAGISEFIIRDFDFSEPLDLLDPRVFPLQASFLGDVQAGDIQVSLVPVTPVLPLLLLGLLLMRILSGRVSENRAFQ